MKDTEHSTRGIKKNYQDSSPCELNRETMNLSIRHYRVCCPHHRQWEPQDLLNRAVRVHTNRETVLDP